MHKQIGRPVLAVAFIRRIRLDKLSERFLQRSLRARVMTHCAFFTNFGRKQPNPTWGLFRFFSSLLFFTVRDLLATPLGTTPSHDWRFEVPRNIETWWNSHRGWMVLPLLTFSSLAFLAPRINTVFAITLALSATWLTLQTRNFFYLVSAILNLLVAVAFLDAWRNWFFERWLAAEQFILESKRKPLSLYRSPTESSGPTERSTETSAKIASIQTSSKGSYWEIRKADRSKLNLPFIAFSLLEVRREREIDALRGLTVFLDDVEPLLPQVLLILRDRLSGCGLQFKCSELRADAHVLIFNGRDPNKISFAITLAFHPNGGLQSECPVNDLPIAVISALADLKSEYSRFIRETVRSPSWSRRTTDDIPNLLRGSDHAY